MHLHRVAFHPDRYPTETHYPFNLPLFRRTREIRFDSPVTLFVGENGSGKSTLLEALAHRCGIHIWKKENERRLEHNPFEDKLYRYISVQWNNGRVPGSFFGAAVFRDFAEFLEEWAAADAGQLDLFGGRSLMTQSHGQSIMSYFKSRYRIKGLYLLDEPETALSPATQLELLDLLANAGTSADTQFILATHSPILLSCPRAVLYSFDHVPVTSVAYEDTAHYRIYKAFFENPRGSAGR